jgi:DNA-3-methyladenine glycosylase
MYAQPGTAYVYFTYGMHYCMNVVCAAEGDPQAVLIRALEPDESSGAALAAMRQRRGVEEIRLLCSGPGRLCRAFEIDRRLNAIDLCTSSELWIERGETRRSRTSARIGIGSSGAWVRRLLRWYDPLSPSVSRRAPVGKRSVRPARARKSP